MRVDAACSIGKTERIIEGANTTRFDAIQGRRKFQYGALYKRTNSELNGLE